MNPPTAVAKVLAFLAQHPGGFPDDRTLAAMGMSPALCRKTYQRAVDAKLLHVRRRGPKPGEGGGKERVRCYLTPAGKAELDEYSDDKHPCSDVVHAVAKMKLSVKPAGVAPQALREEFIAIWWERYARQHPGVPRKLSGQEHGIVSRIVKAWQDEWLLLLQMVKNFHAMDGKREGYGDPTLAWFERCIPRLVAKAVEDLREKREREEEEAAKSPAEKQAERDERRMARIFDAVFEVTGVTTEDRAWMFEYVKDWPDEKRFATHNNAYMRAALTDKQFKRHERDRDAWLAEHPAEAHRPLGSARR